MALQSSFDVIVIGGGHAGCEAAHAAATMGLQTLLLTMAVDSIAQMSCNPAIGGVAKGHLVKEIDALGGLMGQIADETGIQFRTLNTKKGSAVQATRCQSDMMLYKIAMRKRLENTKNLFIQQREAISILWKGNQVRGICTQFSEEITCKALVVTTGTFLNGLIHIGKNTFPAGRAWEFPSHQFSEHLKNKGLEIGRLKTGTTPRLNKHTIDFSKLEAQPGDTPTPYFSFWGIKNNLPQVPCHITYTKKETHEIIRENLSLSALYGGQITSVGPRYCPSIEDKVVKFPEKERHQIFLEPTALDSVEIYPNGVSTSMPLAVQEKFIRSIPGLEKVEIVRPGYAIEYDFLYPHQLKLNLESKDFSNLFFAGQINGTTGYEEAAAQGLLAGINAALKTKEQEPLELLRNESYIGVLIDDLIVKSTEEPYRMFTSRAEYRLLLREDNADQRLCAIGHKIGLLSPEHFQSFLKKQEKIEDLKTYLKKTQLKKTPSLEKEQSTETNLNLSQPAHYNLQRWLKQPDVTLEQLKPYFTLEDLNYLDRFSKVEKNLVENDWKYEGYIKRQETQVKNYLKFGKVKIPQDYNFKAVPSLSKEVIEKLTKLRPQNLEQANKISGITPAAITILYVHLQKSKPSALHAR